MSVGRGGGKATGLTFFINNGAGRRTLVSLDIFYADRTIFIFAAVKNEPEDLIIP